MLISCRVTLLVRIGHVSFETTKADIWKILEAVNEVNAGGGRIVTSPTNGECMCSGFLVGELVAHTALSYLGAAVSAIRITSARSQLTPGLALWITSRASSLLS